MSSAEREIYKREIYKSENGDSWFFCRGDDGVYVHHRANPQSGGKLTTIELGEFLSHGRVGPEHQALRRLIGTLADIQ